MNNAREAILARSEPDSVTRLMDEAVLEQFDRAGMGEHPKFIAMLEALISPESGLTKIRKAKSEAYKLLEEAIEAAKVNSLNALREAAEEALDQFEQMERMFRDDKEFQSALNNLRAALGR